MKAGYDINSGVLVKYSGSETEIVIPDGVTKIGDRAFFNQKSIVSVVMPESVVKIDSHAFEKCIRLKEISFSPNITDIGYDAFSGCKALKEVVLPDALQYLGSGAFGDCEKLTELVCNAPEFVPESDPFQSHSGKDVVGLTDKNGYVVWAKTLFSYIGTSKEIIVPDGVERLADRVFESSNWGLGKKYNFESVVLPDSVKYIGRRAFKNCKMLKSIHIPSGVEIAANAFDACSGLADEAGFFIHDGKVLAYTGDSDTVTVPDGVRVISDHLFANEFEGNPGNRNIHVVNLPDSLEEIGDAAFEGCRLLEKIAIPVSVKKMGANVFKDCDHLVNVVMPHSIEEMGEGVFIGCRGLADENGFIISNHTLHSYYGSDRDIVIPEGIVSIMNNVFNKVDITSIQLPNTLKSLGSAFAGCYSLTEIIIPEGVEAIKGTTFDGCIRLKKVVLPSTIKRIGSWAFRGCEALEDIVIPDNTELIDLGAFERCKSLQSVNLPGSIREIGGGAFAGCTSLADVQLHEGLLKIKYKAFSGCISITELSIPSSVENIEHQAFENCKALKKLHYEKMKGTVDQSAFNGCTGLADENGMTIIAGHLWKYDGPGGDVVVPEGIIALGPDVFREGYNRVWRSHTSYRQVGSLKSVVLPSTVKVIYNNAFDGCKCLTSINIPDGVKVIGEEAFRECSALKKISLPDSLLTLRAKAFRECESLSEIVIPEGIPVIDHEMFFGCKAIRSIGIPASVEDIGEMAFAGCQSLNKFIVSAENNTYSEQDGILMSKSGDKLVCFPAGKKITEYVIPESVSTIGRHAFLDCVKLKKIVIPATVSTIEDEVFAKSGWRNKITFSEIEVDLKAGSKGIGKNIFDLDDGYDDSPIVYPKLPVTFVKEQRAQIRLGLGYCLNPDKYEGEYAAVYKKYVKSHEKTLTKKAVQLDLSKVQEYFAPKQDTIQDKPEYSPNLTMKRPSELAKVEVLEEVVQKGSLKDVIDVLETYKTFEMTARALGIAARFRGIEFVKVLLDHGASFLYQTDSPMRRKYGMVQETAAGYYSTEYYLMLVPEKLSAHGYSPTHGFSNMTILPELKPLNFEKRVEIAKFFMENKTPGVSMDEMLFWALTNGELSFADALIEMGVTLQDTAPSYYDSWGITYIVTITEGKQSLYWNDYVSSIVGLKTKEVMPVLRRFHALAEKAGKQLIISQTMFDGVKWNDESLAFVLKNADMAKVNKKKALEVAVSKNSIEALEMMAEAGWISNSTRRENLIAFARDNRYIDSLAWLMDYKNKHVDLVKEMEKQEKKMFRELSMNPESVTAMKKIWSYKKLDDDSVMITGYKGEETEIVVPSRIGKARVTAIGEEAFSAAPYGRALNKEVRQSITSIVIPESVKEIHSRAFRCCKKLQTVTLMNQSIKIAPSAFWECDLLRDQQGFTIVGGVLVQYYGQSASIQIPKEVTRIGESVFEDREIKSVVLHEGIEIIEKRAFAGSYLEIVHIPNSVTKIEAEAFCNCSKLRDVYIPGTVKHLGKGILGVYDGESISWKSSRPSGIYVYTPSGSSAEEYMKKHYSGVRVVNEYSEA